MQEAAYRNHENWYGSYYELAIDYSHLQSHEDASFAERQVWKAPTLCGPFAGPYSAEPLAFEPVLFPPVWPTTEPLDQYGMIEVQSRHFVGCKITFASEGWFCLGIPMGMLDLVYSVSYPLALEPNVHWMQEVNRVLIDIAQCAYLAVPFDLAVIGEDSSVVYPTVKDSKPSELDHGGCLISPTLFHQMQLRTEWEELSSGLLWRDWQG